MKLSDNIKRLRIKCNLTQQELADSIYVSRSAIANYEAGSRTPDIDTLLLMSKIFKVSLKELVGEYVDEINIVKDEISNTDVLQKKRHHHLLMSILNLILTIALVISLTIVLVPTIKSKLNQNNLKNINIANIEKIEMVLEIERKLYSTPFVYCVENNTFVIENFCFDKIIEENKASINFQIIFYINITEKIDDSYSIKNVNNFDFSQETNNIFYSQNNYYNVFFNPKGTFDIILYYKNKLWYLETYY